MEFILFFVLGIIVFFIGMLVVTFFLGLFWSLIIYFMHVFGISFTFVNYRGEENSDNVRYYVVENKKINDYVNNNK